MLTHKALAGMARDAVAVAPDQAIADGYSVTDVINLGGRWLTASHQWAWLDQAVATMDYVAGQEYASLPSDFRSLGTVTLTNGLVGRVHLTSMDQIVKMRTSNIGGTLDRWIAISYRATTKGTRFPVLELYPTPSSAATAPMTIYYSAGWAEMTDDSHAPVPSFMDPLLVETVRSYAQGLAEEGGSGVAERLGALKQSQFYRAFQRQDGQTQDEFGRVLNTAGTPSLSSSSPPFGLPYLNPGS